MLTGGRFRRDPGNEQVAERALLLEGDASVPVQIEDGEEARHDLIGIFAVCGQIGERRPPAARSFAVMMPVCSRTVVRGTYRCAVETTGTARGASAAAATAANCRAVSPSSTSGSRSANPGSIGTRRGNLRPWSAIWAEKNAAASL